MSVVKAERDIMISAAMRRFLRQEAAMIAKIDRFRGDIPDKKRRRAQKKRP